MYFDRINSTICAIATAKGSSIGIIRVSGSKAFEIAAEMTSSSTLEHQKARLVKIRKDGKVIEQCLLLPFKAPHSFTGEDVVEFQLHGASGNAEEIMALIIEKGAVPAQKGEFSFRAVMNSKMTADEAIALNTLITSENPFAIELSRKAAFEENSLEKLRSLLPEWEYFETLATAVIDFPDQVSVNLDFKRLSELMTRSENHLQKVLENSKALEKMVDYHIIILGKPNVGKSSLFNLLIDQERAIVSNIPGTTRDYISETFYAKGFQAKLTDSAGIRITSSDIEAKGIEKSRNLLEKGDLLIILLDASRPLDGEDLEILRETCMKSRLVVKNKCDCAGKDKLEIPIGENEEILEISCAENKGIEELKKRICENIMRNMPDKNESIFFSSWQKGKAEETLSKLEELRMYINSDQIEIIHFFVHDIFFSLKDLAGDLTSHDVYEKIFGGFCLGK